MAVKDMVGPGFVGTGGTIKWIVTRGLLPSVVVFTPGTPTRYRHVDGPNSSFEPLLGPNSEFQDVKGPETIFLGERGFD